MTYQDIPTYLILRCLAQNDGKGLDVYAINMEAMGDIADEHALHALCRDLSRENLLSHDVFTDLYRITIWGHKWLADNRLF